MAITAHWIGARLASVAEGQATYENIDDELLALARNRDEAAMLDALRSGRLSVDHLHEEGFDLVALAAVAKLPQVFDYILANPDHVIRVGSTRYIFVKNEDLPRESVIIARRYLSWRYTKNQERVLDSFDGLFASTGICRGSGFAPDEVREIFEGMNIRFDNVYVQFLSEVLREMPDMPPYKRKCYEALLMQARAFR